MKRAIIILAILLALAALVVILSRALRMPDTPEIPAPEQETETLPEPVARTRNAILDAARNESYEALADIAPPDIRYTFGAPEEEGFAAYLARTGRDTDHFETIEEILTLPYAVQEDIYTWPSFFPKTADEWTAQDIALMRTIIADETIESYRAFGAYIGYRIGIREDGAWLYYVAGD